MTLAVAGAAGCAKQTTGRKRLPPPGREVPKDAVRPVSVPPPGEIATPERRASMRLVERGRGRLDMHDLEGAAASFRDAINVDGTNGVAYYYLAYVYAGMGRKELALGLLDKAEANLGVDEEWSARIRELRAELEGNAPPPVETMTF